MKGPSVTFTLAAIVLLSSATQAASTALTTAADPVESAATQQQQFDCLQGWESFLPGDYYACRARYHLQRKHSLQAVAMLKEAAYWANKDAQHALGLVYINGDIAGIATNRSLGIAWLALAAERKKPDYVRDYSIAVSGSSPGDLAQATRIYTRLRNTYGDRKAGPRAINRFIRRVKPLDDAAAMGGNLAYISGLTPFPQGAMDLSRTIHAHAAEVFDGLQGTVTVGLTERVEAPSPALRNKYTEPLPTPGSSRKPD